MKNIKISINWNRVMIIIYYHLKIYKLLDKYHKMMMINLNNNNYKKYKI